MLSHANSNKPLSILFLCIFIISICFTLVVTFRTPNGTVYSKLQEIGVNYRLKSIKQYFSDSISCRNTFKRIGLNSQGSTITEIRDARDNKMVFDHRAKIRITRPEPSAFKRIFESRLEISLDFLWRAEFTRVYRIFLEINKSNTVVNCFIVD